MEDHVFVVTWRYYADQEPMVRVFDGVWGFRNFLHVRAPENVLGIQRVIAWCPVPLEAIKGLKDKTTKIFRTTYHHPVWNNGQPYTDIIDNPNEVRLWYNRNTKTEGLIVDSIEVAAAVEDLTFEQGIKYPKE